MQVQLFLAILVGSREQIQDIDSVHIWAFLCLGNTKVILQSNGLYCKIPLAEPG